MTEEPTHDHLLTAKRAAEVIGTTESTLKQSRYTGHLFGKAAPAFIRFGRCIRYRQSTLLKFVHQFPEIKNTSC